jgi:hypothetical protein
VIFLALPAAVWLSVAIAAAFAVGLLGWQALSLWRNVKELKESMERARGQMVLVVNDLNVEVRRANEGLERIGRSAHKDDTSGPPAPHV